MLKNLGFVSALAGAASVISALYVFYGLATDAFDGSRGMAVLSIQLFGFIAAAAAMLFAIIARSLAFRKNQPVPRTVFAGIVLGFAGIAAHQITMLSL